MACVFHVLYIEVQSFISKLRGGDVSAVKLRPATPEEVFGPAPSTPRARLPLVKLDIEDGNTEVFPKDANNNVEAIVDLQAAGDIAHVKVEADSTSNTEPDVQLPSDAQASGDVNNSCDIVINNDVDNISVADVEVTSEVDATSDVAVTTDVDDINLAETEPAAHFNDFDDQFNDSALNWADTEPDDERFVEYSWPTGDNQDVDEYVFDEDLLAIRGRFASVCPSLGTIEEDEVLVLDDW